MLYPTELLTHLVNNNKYNSTKKTKCQEKLRLKLKKSEKTDQNYLKKIFKKPNNPKTIKVILDNNSIKLCLKCLPSNLPQEIAIKLLITIPQIEPKIKGNLALGYSNPRLKEAKKVLSPNSPTKIQKATIKTQFNFKQQNLCNNLDLEETQESLLVLQTWVTLNL